MAWAPCLHDNGLLDDALIRTARHRLPTCIRVRWNSSTRHSRARLAGQFRAHDGVYTRGPPGKTNQAGTELVRIPCPTPAKFLCCSYVMYQIAVLPGPA